MGQNSPVILRRPGVDGAHTEIMNFLLSWWDDQKRVLWNPAGWTPCSSWLRARTPHCSELETYICIKQCAFSGCIKIFYVLIFSWEYQEGKDCRNALTVLWSPFPQRDARRKRPCLIHWCFQKEPARCLPSIGLICLIKPCWVSEVSWEKLRHKRMISHGLKWHTSFPLPCLVFQRRNLDPCSFFFLIGDPSMSN